MVGRTLAHYRITAAIGAGGMGEVYRAPDTTLGREVAIKVLPVAFAAEPERLARFEREAKLLARLRSHRPADEGRRALQPTPPPDDRLVLQGYFLPGSSHT